MERGRGRDREEGGTGGEGMGGEGSGGELPKELLR